MAEQLKPRNTIRWSAGQNCQSFVDSSPDGELEGSVELPDSSLTVGSNGRIRANLLARSIVVEGRVDGNLYGAERAELKKSATVVGDIYSPRIAIEDGAIWEGNVQVHKDIPNPQTKKEDDAATAK